jgi:Protein of unknown function (DUF4197)
MKKLLIIAAVAIAPLAANAQIKGILDQVNDAVGNNGKNLTNADIIGGLKEALTIGSNNSTAKASALNGFFGNSLIKIPFPPEAKQVETTAKALGLTKQVDKFVLTLNRAAETAAKDAAPIFVNAVKALTINDGLTILNGGDNAATTYLRGKTELDLKTKFRPVVKAAITKVQLTKYWNPIITKYNKVPGVRKMNPDLEDYVTTKAIEGLFKLIAQEEAKIRKDPAAQVTSLLQKVFGK